MRMSTLARTWLAIAALSVAHLAAQPAAAQKGISLLDRNLSLQMLANLKSDLKNNYYDTRFHGMDLEAAFAEAEQRIRAAASVNDTVGVLAELLTRLDDSHTRFL